MTKKILITAVAVAFVAGTLVSAQTANGLPNGNPFQELWDTIVNMQLQIDEISSSIQTDGTSTLSFSEGDITLEAAEGGKVNIVGDTKINSLLEVGPTNIDSITGNVLVGGSLTCNNPEGCIGSEGISSQTLGKIQCNPDQIVMRDSEGGSWICAEAGVGMGGVIESIQTLENEILELNTFSRHEAFFNSGEEPQVITKILSCEANDVIETWGFNIEQGGTLVKADISDNLVSMTVGFLVPTGLPSDSIFAEIFCRGIAEEG